MDDVSCGSHFLTHGGGCPMTACHVAVLTAHHVQVAANDWYEVAEVAGRLANKGVTRVHGDKMLQRPPPSWPIPQDLALDLRTMEELCQPTMNGRGRPIAPVNIQATNFGLKNHMIQQVQQSCQYHGLPGDDTNKHIDKFLIVT
ncbi:hypothetical protein Tco_0837953 [Tanacetum coccineum]